MKSHRDEIGQALREARQAAGLSLGDIASRIKVKPVYLQAIEAGEFDRLPALPQTLGFTRSYARLLDVDVAAPLAQLGEEVHRDIESADYSSPDPSWREVPLRQIVWGAAGAALGMLLIAALLFDFSTPPPQWASVAEAPVAATPVVRPVPDVTTPAAETPAAAPQSSVHGSAPVSAAMAGLLAGLSADTRVPGEAVPSAAPQLFATRDVHLRAAPANEAAVRGVLAACEALAVMDADADGPWRAVRRSDGTTGWVYQRYVSASVPPAC
ncbi:MAG: helix-turn-helix domain-containing protein [Parvibaculum sp.]|nr:helix-turn-helix domain-containing protein [Parvibaculum sp.]